MINLKKTKKNQNLIIYEEIYMKLNKCHITVCYYDS